MTKLCPRGKSAAKRKFKVYPSAYANAYASKICAGKIKDPSGTKRKDFKGPKPAGKAKSGIIEKTKKFPRSKTGPRPKQKLPEKFYQKPQNPTKTPRLRRPKMKSGGLAKKGRGCEIR